tara:strand:- start:144 stop:665 length:522 start_codon:yes stop_codon:yes gene_type:complete
MEKLDKQKCGFCGKNELTLVQDGLDIPFFGKVFVFSMDCSECGFSKSDVEAEEIREPCKITFEVKSEEDMKVRVIKSSSAMLKIPELRLSVRPGPAAEGYVSNVEGVLGRFKKVVEDLRDSADDDKDKKSAKNLLKKMWKVECGDIPVKIVIEDPTGNSGIVSDRTKVEKLKK